MEQKELTSEVTVAIDATMSIVGVLMFFPLVVMVELNKYSSIMVKFLTYTVGGLALVGRMVLYPKLCKTLRTIAKVI